MRRAELLLAEERNTSSEHAARMLRDDAAASGISVHAAALATVASLAVAEVVDDRPGDPDHRSPLRR